MKGKNVQQKPALSPPIVDDKGVEKLTTRLRDWGLIVNAAKPAKATGKKKGGKR